jgi:uncharacterized membrane protein
LYLGSRGFYSPAGTKLWLVGGGLMLAQLPYTMAAIMPVNKQLNSEEAELAPEGEVRAHLERWGKLHSVRAALSATAVCLFVVAIVRL